MLKNFEQCPKMYAAKSVYKTVKYIQGEEAKWGEVVHDAIEDHVNTGSLLPDELQHIVPLIDGLRKAGFLLYAEIPMAVTRDWKPCDWWSAWIRGKVDLFAWHPETQEAHVFDWKTGKRFVPKGDDIPDRSQLELYGAMAVSALNLNKVTTHFFWFQTKQTDKLVVDRSTVEAIKLNFAKRIDSMGQAHETEEFPAKTSALCPWCPLLETCDEAVVYRKKARFLRNKKK